MKKFVPLIALALTLSLSTSAFAMEVPTDTVVQNLNGSQQVIKTYTIDPGTDPQELIEEPFVLDGYADNTVLELLYELINKKTSRRVKLPEGVFDMTTAVHGLYETGGNQ